MEKDIVFLSLEEIIKINKELGYSPMDEGQLEFIFTKIKSMKNQN